jgi:hypothetical protein
VYGNEPASTSEGIQLDETAGEAMEIECNHEDAIEDANTQGRSRENEKRAREEGFDRGRAK